jgi:NADH:ubiquinone oxidoreductase subunit 5 (subunit L)/multisubunit Na+/H+ antiporter MnhA subunit
VAVAQTDIKKVLAYSTVSQLGYLFLAVGVGAYVPAIFHMVTHAFFKALLFLGSGSVIHGLHDEQDMRRMGGLTKYMPVTAFTFIIGWLAIAGVPPFSGFWSKDEILLYAWNNDAVGGKALWAIGLITALLTAFYMTRQVILTFYGRTRFFDPTADEIDAAVDARVQAAHGDIDAAGEARGEAEAAAAKAGADVTKKEEALATARTKLTEAEAAVAASSEGADGHDKLVKALDKATKAVPKAETALTKAQDTAAEKAGAVEAAAAAMAKAEGAVLTVENELARVERPSEWVTARTEPVDVGPLADDLPESYHHRQEYHPHESPWTMTLPLIVLAFFATVAGFINLPFSKDLHFLGHWLEPSLFGHEAKLAVGTSTKWALAIIAILVGLVAIVASFRVYLRGAVDPRRIEAKPLARAWYVDESYAGFMGGPGRRSFDLMAWFDRTIVDGAVRGLARVVWIVGDGLRELQSGFVRSYALSVGVGSVLVMAWFVGRLF